jgi:hypothetical protein
MFMSPWIDMMSSMIDMILNCKLTLKHFCDIKCMINAIIFHGLCLYLICVRDKYSGTSYEGKIEFKKIFRTLILQI